MRFQPVVIKLREQGRQFFAGLSLDRPNLHRFPVPAAYQQSGSVRIRHSDQLPLLHVWI